MKRSDTESYERTNLAAAAKKRPRRRPSLVPLVIFAQSSRAAWQPLALPPAYAGVPEPMPPIGRDEPARRGVRIIDIA